MLAGPSVKGWKKFYMNKSMYHLLANINTISLMAYLWITQSCWGDSSSIFQWPFSFLFFSYKLNLLGGNWFAKSYRFQVYDSIKHNLPTALPQAKPISIPIYPLCPLFLVSEPTVGFKVSSLGPTATVRRTCWVLHLHRVSAYKRSQGKRRHMGCNDLEKCQAEECF